MSLPAFQPRLRVGVHPWEHSFRRLTLRFRLRSKATARQAATETAQSARPYLDEASKFKLGDRRDGTLPFGNMNLALAPAQAVQINSQNTAVFWGARDYSFDEVTSLERNRPKPGQRACGFDS
jgi:hypothetical protein